MAQYLCLFSGLFQTTVECTDSRRKGKNKELLLIFGGKVRRKEEGGMGRMLYICSSSGEVFAGGIPGSFYEDRGLGVS